VRVSAPVGGVCGAEERQEKNLVCPYLRESGSLEQDANVVMLLHREDLYDRESTHPGETDIPSPQRDGATEVVALGAQFYYARFRDLAGW
jgi:replicative DNA helicase